MMGDKNDIVNRLKMALPSGWFSDNTPVLDAVLAGLASAWGAIYELLSYVKAQTRIETLTGVLLDVAAVDFFGGNLARRVGESDLAFGNRIKANLIQERATRSGLISLVVKLTGRVPNVFEPFNVSDTGAYNANLGYNTSGGYGSLKLPFQFFVTAYRPNSLPVSNCGGYGAGPGGYGTPPMCYGSLASLSGNISDEEIYDAIASALPACAIAWTRISN